MLERIVYAINMLKAFITLLSDEYLDNWKKLMALFEVATVTAVDWDGVEIEAAAPSALLSFNVDDLYTLVVDGFQSFVNVLLPFGPWLLPMLSLCVGMIYMLGVRPVERLDGLAGISRCTAATFILAVSYLAFSMAPAWMNIASVVASLLGTGCDWIKWTMRRLVDVLCGCALCVDIFVFRELNVTMLVVLMTCCAGGHAILSVLDLYFPMSWLCIDKWACDLLTFSIVEGIRNVLALAWKAVVAVCGAIVAVATDTANNVQTICWTMHRLLDLLFVHELYLQAFVFKEFDMTILLILVAFWSVGHAVLDLCLPVLNFPLVANLQLVWWAIRNMLALVWLYVVAVWSAAAAGATIIANDVQHICSFLYNGSVQAVSDLSAVRVSATFMASLVAFVVFFCWDYYAYVEVNTSNNPAAIQIPTAADLSPVPMMANAFGEDKMVDTAAAYASSVARDFTANMDPEFAQDVEAFARNAGIFVGAIADKLKADFPELFEPNFHAADAGQNIGAAMNARPFAPN
jgi:hypothetical protein